MSASSAKQQASILEQEQIVPEVINTVPPKQVSVTFKDGVDVVMGTVLTLGQTQEVPMVTWEADPDKYYTLLKVDPDAPARTGIMKKLISEVQHWLVVNIPGNDVLKGQVLSDYGGAGAPKRMGFHRYVFLVYEQHEKIEFEEPRIEGGFSFKRMRFSAKAFAAKYNLGEPIAANFYLAQWTED